MYPTVKIIVLYCQPCDILTYITKADKFKLVLIFVNSCNHTVIYQNMLTFSDNIKTNRHQNNMVYRTDY